MPFTVVPDVPYVKLTSNKKTLANFIKLLRFFFHFTFQAIKWQLVLVLLC